MIANECLGKGYDTGCSFGPDAPIRGIGLTKAVVKPGEETIIKSKIVGIGAWFIICGNFRLNYYFDGVFIGCYKDRITKGQTWWVQFPYTIPAGTSPGSHTIKVEETASNTHQTTTIAVRPDEGKLVITSIDKPSEFTPNKEFTIGVRVKNEGGTDDVFIRIKDKDTGRTLKETAHRASADASFGQSYKITLDQTTDFHCRVETGHVT